jgi:hypothetical protein
LLSSTNLSRIRAFRASPLGFPCANDTLFRYFSWILSRLTATQEHFIDFPSLRYGKADFGRRGKGRLRLRQILRKRSCALQVHKTG